MNSQSVIPAKAQLFYIYTGSWRDNAAGIKVMHFLCDALNRTGQHAFLVLGNHNRGTVVLNNKLITPVLSRDLARLHLQRGEVPRVIYSETITGNPLHASCVIRYFLNYPGALGGSLKLPATEMQVAYTKNIKKQLSESSIVLFLPAVDLEELPKELVIKEDYHLYYAGKYKAFVGNPELPSGLKMKEVSRIETKGNTRNELLILLAKAKSIFLFENSTLATEAVLMGTPVVYIDNPFLGTIIAEQELGVEGTTNGYSEDGILAAVGSIDVAKRKYLIAQNDFWRQLNEFVTASDIFFQDTYVYPLTKTRVPGRIYAPMTHKINLFIGVMRNYGLLKALRVSFLLSINLTKKNKK